MVRRPTNEGGAALTVTVADVVDAISARFPLSRAEPWDRNGLAAGDPAREVTSVVVTLDPTVDEIERASSENSNLLVSHHPAALRMPDAIAPGRGASGVLFAALDAGVALVNAHTNLDRHPDAQLRLPELLGLEPTAPLESSLQPMTLVTVFSPAEASEALVAAMAGAGAGRIGDYTDCAFLADGTGGFTPASSSHPAVGAPETHTEVPETRIEMVCPRDLADAVVESCRAAHPYEEPLIVTCDVAIGRNAARLGMTCTAPAGETLSGLAARAGRALGGAPRVWGIPDAAIHSVATATGSGGALISKALSAGVDVLVAGEVRYHDAMEAVAGGLCIIELGHDISEWPLVSVLADAVRATPGLDPHRIVVRSFRPSWWTPGMPPIKER